MPLLPLGRLITSERLLRRAHLVLAWLLHFYVHTQPLASDPITIPRSLSAPLLAVSRELLLPPVVTYADTVLYNWRQVDGQLRCVTLFTGTADEEHFFLTSARIELAGVAALSLMQQSLDEAFVDDAVAHRRIASYLRKLSAVIRNLTVILDAVRDGCDPTVFYDQVRPWLRGEDSGKRLWVFQDERGNDVDLGETRELSGPSAGQSTLVHALDIFLGVDHSATPAACGLARPSSGSSTTRPHSTPFLDRMQAYMPRHHRNFINHLKTVPRPIRKLAMQSGPDSPIQLAYNEAVTALKEFRNAHIQIATLYIVTQSHRRQAVTVPASPKVEPAKGTGGTDLVPFLKSSRDDTANTLLRSDH
jgi:indoleamine 2,3-dioxygenase